MRKIFTLQFHENKYNRETKKKSFKTLKNNELNYSAPDHCLQNIMNFARSYRVANSTSAGNVEMILN